MLSARVHQRNRTNRMGIHIHGEREIYFKELANAIMGAGKSKVGGRAHKMETQGRADFELQD